MAANALCFSDRALSADSRSRASGRHCSPNSSIATAGGRCAPARRRARRAAASGWSAYRLGAGYGQGAATVLMFDCGGGAEPRQLRPTSRSCWKCCRSGLALVDRDGRFLTMNKAFRVAGGIARPDMPSYPWRPGGQGGQGGGGPTRCAATPAARPCRAICRASWPDQPTEPVAMTVAGAARSRRCRGAAAPQGQ